MADKVSTIFTPSQKYYSVRDLNKKDGLELKNIVAFLITFVGVILSAYFAYLLLIKPKNLPKPYLLADVYYGEAKVFVDDKEVGTTPIENLVVKKGQRKVRLESKEGIVYESVFDFLPGYPVLIRRDLGIDNVFSAGLDAWVEKSKGGTLLSIISDPSGAKVFIDGAELGVTPFSTDKLTEGAYEIRVEKEGYEPVSERLSVIKDKKVNISFKLFPLPISASVNLLPGSSNLYDIVASNPVVFENPSLWAKGLIYWNKTRGINILGYGINREPVFKYILDYNGVFYDLEANKVDPASIALGDGKIAYLRPPSDNQALTDKAKESLSKLGQGVSLIKKAKVKDTPTGWLRVRKEPSLAGVELGKVNAGEILEVLETRAGWVKVKTKDGLEGWCASDYLQLL